MSSGKMYCYVTVVLRKQLEVKTHLRKMVFSMMLINNKNCIFYINIEWTNLCMQTFSFIFSFVLQYPTGGILPKSPYDNDSLPPPQTFFVPSNRLCFLDSALVQGI